MTHHGSSAFTAAAAALAILAAPAVAADGEVLINQAKAIAGGITPGDAPGFPITISRPGKYKLASTLRLPLERNGIEITSNDVTIDFNGFTMTGANRAAFGILSSGQGSLTVMNGTIVAFLRTGIRTASPRAVIENMRVIDNGDFGIDVGNESRISRSTVSGNPGVGITCGQGCLIEQSIIARNEAGIVLRAGGMVLGNVIVSNSESGIIGVDGLSGFGNNTLIGNNNGNSQAAGQLITVHPNACQPTCPF